MERSTITGVAIGLCAFWVAWLLFDSYFNSGLVVYSDPSQPAFHTWAFSWTRIVVTLIEVAATAVAALIVSLFVSHRER